MSIVPDPEPDQPAIVFTVGQDRAGHWLVQRNGGGLEGRFVSQAAALAYARAEQRAVRGAVVAVAQTPLTPFVPFAPAQPWECALRRAA